MRFHKIINQLPAEVIQTLCSRNEITPNQLSGYFLEAKVFSKNYQTLTKRTRRIFDFVYENSQDMTVKTLQTSLTPTRYDLKTLIERALLFVLPSLEQAERVVIPAEYLFFPEIPFPDAGSLVQVFRWYKNIKLFPIAKMYHTRLHQQFEYNAALLYEKVINGVKEQFDQLSEEQIAFLEYVSLFGGQVSVSRFQKKFFRQINNFFSNQRPMVDEFLGVNQVGELSDLQKLFTKCFLVFLNPPESGKIMKIGIPGEILPELTRKFQKPLDAKIAALESKLMIEPEENNVHSNEHVLFSDLKKLLLVVENINPRATSTGLPFKTDLRQMLLLLNKEKKYWLFLFQYASWLGLLSDVSGTLKTNPSCVHYLNLTHQDRHLLSLKYLKEVNLADNEPENFKEQLIHQYMLGLFNKYKNKFIKTAYFYEYAALQPDYIALFEDFSVYVPQFNNHVLRILKRYFWLGLLDADPEFHYVRPSAAGQYAICGMLKRFQAPEPEEDKFIVQPNYEIIAVCNMQFETLLHLARIAIILQIDITIRYQFNKNQIIRAINKGMTVQEITTFLQSNSKTVLPQTILYLLKELNEKEGEIALVPVSGYLKFRDEKLLAQVKKMFPDIVLETIEPDQLLLKAGVDLTQIEHQIKQKGFFIQSNLSLPSTAKNENQQLMKLLESVEPPPFNLDELPFGNPATNAVDIQKLFQFAIEHQLKVKIEYSNDSYSTSMRKIEPHRLYENILEAYCHSREMTRAFRLDRIRMAKLLR